MKMLLESDTKKETLPVAFFTDFISKGWEEVGVLKEEIKAITETFKDTEEIEDILTSLADSYLICIGRCEALLSEQQQVEKPEIAESEVEEVEEPTEQQAREEEAEKATEEKDVVETEIDDSDFEEEELLIKKGADKTEIDEFEYFVDFDEPDLSTKRLTDKDLYPEA